MGTTIKQNRLGKIYEIYINNTHSGNSNDATKQSHMGAFFRLMDSYNDLITTRKINIRVRGNVYGSSVNLIAIKRHCDLSFDATKGTIKFVFDPRMSYKINISTTTPGISFEFYNINSYHNPTPVNIPSGISGISSDFYHMDHIVDTPVAYDKLVDKIKIEYTLTPECIKKKGINLVSGILNIKPNKICQEIIIPENKNIKKIVIFTDINKYLSDIKKIVNENTCEVVIYCVGYIIDAKYVIKNLLSIYNSGLKEFTLHINRIVAKGVLSIIKDTDIKPSKALELISNKLKALLYKNKIKKPKKLKMKLNADATNKTKRIKNKNTKTKRIKRPQK